MNTKPIASFDQFNSLDIRVGTVLSVELANTKKPTYRIRVDFGPEVGHKISCGAYTNYSPAYLMGKKVVAVINFGPKKMGPEISEVLILGVRPLGGEGTVFLTTETDTRNGEIVF